MRQGKRAEATDQLLEIVKRDRKWNDAAGAKSSSCSSSTPGGRADQATMDGTQAAIDDLVLVAHIRKNGCRFCEWNFAPKLMALKASTGAADADQCRIIAGPATFPR